MQSRRQCAANAGYVGCKQLSPRMEWRGLSGFAGVAGIAMVLLASGAASAAGIGAYPDKPIRVIVPTSAGTTTDLLIRAIAPEMGKALGQPLVIEARPGANQVIGYEYCAKQVPADGYTACMVGVDGLALLPAVTKEMRFDAFRDLPPVIGLAESRYVLRSHASAPWTNFAEFVAYVKANPGKINYGASAPQVRFPMLLIMRQLGLDMLHVPYGGGARYLQALMAGEVHIGFTGEAAMAGAGDRVRGLAVTGDKRAPAYPDLPTFGQLKFPQIRGPSYSLNVRAGTPPDAVKKLHDAAGQALNAGDVRASLAKFPMEVLNESAEATQKRLVDAGRFYAEFAKAADIKPE